MFNKEVKEIYNSIKDIEFKRIFKLESEYKHIFENTMFENLDELIIFFIENIDNDKYIKINPYSYGKNGYYGFRISIFTGGKIYEQIVYKSSTLRTSDMDELFIEYDKYIAFRIKCLKRELIIDKILNT